MEWVDIFHRLIEAGYYLVATEITPDTANPILGGLLHYGSSGRFMLLINAPGGDLYSGAALVDCLRSRESGIYTVVLGIAASVAYLLAITALKVVKQVARSSSQFHRLAQLLLGPAEHAHGASGALHSSLRDLQMSSVNLWTGGVKSPRKYGIQSIARPQLTSTWIPPVPSLRQALKSWILVART